MTQAQPRRWRLRYAPHLGYRSPEAPLLQFTAPPDPVAQVHRAAALGFAGVQDPWAVARPPEQRRAIRRALDDAGLQAGAVVWAPFDRLRQPLLGQPDADAELERLIDQAIATAIEMGSRTIAVLGAASEGDQAPQRDLLARRLRQFAGRAADHEIVFGLEPMGALPGMLMRTLRDGLDVIALADTPEVRLIYDTGHVEAVDGQAGARFAEAYPLSCLVQLADQPGRVEPGAGTIDFAPVFRELIERGRQDLIELEHGWAAPGPGGEEAGLRRLADQEEAAMRAIEREKGPQ